VSLGEEWERHAATWIRFTPHDVFFQRYNWPAFVDLLPPAGRATLDLGCGEGRIGVLLGELGHRVTGVDVAPSMARRAAERGVYAEVHLGDAASLPFREAAFDLVVAFMTLQDMEDPAAALREAARVLEPGGALVAAVVHPFNTGRERPYYDVARIVDEFERGGVTMTFHQIHRPLESWFALVREAGLEIEALREPRPPEGVPELAHVRDRPVFLQLRCRRP
jgi:ubiquinone/menaquinone biosynthesis C-methylase UbiE